MAELSPRWSRTKGRVLVVDDDEDLRVVTRHILSRGGFEVLFAADGDQALSVIARERDALSVVLLDIAIPGRSGLDIARDLASTAAHLPVVLMSGIHRADTSGTRLSNVTAFLPKPFTPKVLLAAIEQAIAQSLQRR